MKKLVSVILAFIMLVPAWAYASESTYIDLDGQWDFACFEDGVIPEGAVCTDKIEVPGAMELQGFGYPAYYYETDWGRGREENSSPTGAGYYVRSFNAPSSGRAYLVFDSVKDRAEVILNGESVGESTGGAIGAVFEVNLKKGENRLEVKVCRDKSGINKADNFDLSGITGDVYITSASPYESASSRDVKIQQGELYIDGVKTVLRGVRYTPTAPDTGDSVTRERIEADLSLIKEYGFNSVWTSAAPPAFYETAEKLGLYVIDEANINLDEMREPSNRALEMVKRHRKYKSIIMWSLGSGEGRGAESLEEAVRGEDDRPLTSDAVFAPEIEIFGATGGLDEKISEWGEGNIGGFIKEFADRELYTRKNIYSFETTDEKTGEVISASGEIKNYLGSPYFDEGELKVDVDIPESFTVSAEVSDASEERVIFKSGNVELGVGDWEVYAVIGESELRSYFEGGKIALAYDDGEAQLFSDDGFSDNIITEARTGTGYEVGEGSAPIGEILIYDHAATLDELLEDADDGVISKIDFDDIVIKEDSSYYFLGYGGDFGDEPNSYYKSLKGLFTSLREPHPEAEEVKAIFEGRSGETIEKKPDFKAHTYAVPAVEGDFGVLRHGNAEAKIAKTGEIVSYRVDGEEKLEDALRPTTMRMSTLSESETAIYYEEPKYEVKSFKADGSYIISELRSADGNAMTLGYAMDEDGKLHVSMTAETGKTETSFVGFYGYTKYDTVKWTGTEGSAYPDRMTAAKIGEHESRAESMSDNYSVLWESGNRLAEVYTLKKGGDTLTFDSTSPEGLWCASWGYDPELYYDHDEDAEPVEGSYVRVGGYISGLSGDSLDGVQYGFSMTISTDSSDSGETEGIFIDGEPYREFNPCVMDYVYRTSTIPTIDAGAAEVTYLDGGAEIKTPNNTYRIYFAPEDTALADLDGALSDGARIEDATIPGNRMEGETDETYEDALSMQAGAKVSYDVSHYGENTFSAIVAKPFTEMNGMGGWDRARAEAEVTVRLDGVEVLKESGISFMSGKREISVDISDARELTIEVAGADCAVLDAKITPRGAQIFGSAESGRVTILNPDRESVTAIMAAKSGETVSAESANIRRGHYRTLELENVSDGAEIKLHIGA